MGFGVSARKLVKLRIAMRRTRDLWRRNETFVSRSEFCDLTEVRNVERLADMEMGDSTHRILVVYERMVDYSFTALQLLIKNF